MKKLLLSLLLLLTAIAVTGCCLSHDWQEASCISPKTCAKCGATEGEALGHDLTNANYQQAASCKRCGETVGEPLTAGFEELGIECFTELDRPYEYITDCNDAPLKTKGSITFSDFKTFESDEAHPAVEGYEWQTVTATVVFNDMNNAVYGSSFTQGFCNYYRVNENTNDVNFYGVDYPEYKVITEKPVDGEWSGSSAETASIKTVYKFYILAPKGYDGTVIFFCDNEMRALIMANRRLEDCVNDNALFFRVNADK